MRLVYQAGPMLASAADDAIVIVVVDAEVHGALPIALREAAIGQHIVGELADKRLIRAPHGSTEGCAFKPELLSHAARVVAWTYASNSAIA